MLIKTREQDNISNIVDACDSHEETFDTEAETPGR